jgi:hypothetical protein
MRFDSGLRAVCVRKMPERIRHFPEKKKPRSRGVSKSDRNGRATAAGSECTPVGREIVPAANEGAPLAHPDHEADFYDSTLIFARFRPAALASMEA